MRNIIGVVFFTVVVASLPAQGYFTVSLGVDTGIISGQGEEILYRSNSSDAYRSQLLWDMQPLFYVGANADFAWKRGTSTWGAFAQVSGKYGIPGKTGVMEDRDWTSDTDPNWLTHYSVHDNYTKNAILADVRVGSSLNIKKNFTLKLYCSYSFMTFSWNASGGSALYPSNGHYSFPADEIGVIYKQTWHTIASGLSFGGTFNRYFSAEVALGLASLVWCNTVDDHLLRYFRETGEFWFGLAIDPSLVFSYTPTDKFILSFNVAGRFSDTRGRAFRDYSPPSTSEDTTSSNSRGAIYKAFEVGITIKYRLL